MLNVQWLWKITFFQLSKCTVIMITAYSILTMWAQVHLQSTRVAEAFVALWERADTGSLVGIGVSLFGDIIGFPLPPAAVIHQVGLKVPLTPVPYPTCFTGEDVLWNTETSMWRQNYNQCFNSFAELNFYVLLYTVIANCQSYLWMKFSSFGYGIAFSFFFFFFCRSGTEMAKRNCAIP